MSGNHPSELSPRQRMINMMYLVLTALLALNVSKEVLQSFFDVNKGIERTTANFNLKNGETYAAFDNAVGNNPEKYRKVKEKAYSIKQKADEIVVSIQEMKYSLVLKADGKVYLGPESGFRDEEGDLIKEKAITKEWKDLVGKEWEKYRTMNIGELSVKDDRSTSGDLFWKENRKSNKATDLKENILKYRDFLVSIAEENSNLKESITKVFKLEGNLGKKKNESWEEYNFHDMPAVGALTLLSKMQADVRNVEADVINYLKRDIEGKLLKFGGAEGIQIPTTNFVLRGDSFRAKIFITAKNPGQDPDIYVGEVDSLGGGKYEMVGDYETVKIVNGKGIFSTRTSSEGNKKWGGLIAMKTETGTKFYPFAGEYLVAAKTAVVAPTNMMVLYLRVPNPIKVSVPGFPASEVIATTNNGTISTINKSKGEYIVEPTKLTSKSMPIISLYVIEDGKRKLMGTADFKVKDVPDPIPVINGKRGGIISKSDLLAAQMIIAQMKDFPFDRNALSFKVRSFDIVAYFKGKRSNFPTVKGSNFNEDVIDAIKSTTSGTEITFSNIKAKRRGVKGSKQRDLGSITFKIK